jgi:ATP-dependent protease ClpP protease subunit
MNTPKMEYLNSARRNCSEGHPREYMVGYTPHRSGTYRIEIDATIECVSQFSTAIQVLENAKDEDEIVVCLQTNGGSVNAGEALIHAMRKCAAPIHIVATGSVHSMGTCILLEADSLELSHGFNACIHAGYDGSGGTVSEYRAKSVFDNVFRIRQFRETYEGFLSEKEMDDMLDGKDIWLDAEGWLERAMKRSQYFQDKFAQQQADEDEAMLAEVEAELAKRDKPRKSRVKKEVDNAQ